MRKETDSRKHDSILHASTLGSFVRRGTARGWKAIGGALLAALILVPTVHAQAEPTPASKAWSVATEKGARLYSVSFEGGYINDLKRLWTNAFTSDNFLMNIPDRSVELPAFQLRDMTLPELGRSIAFLSRGAVTVEVVERNETQPGNIWRVARHSLENLSQSIKMRAVPAPRIFANESSLERFLVDVEMVQRRMLETFYELRKTEGSMPTIGVQVLPLKGQRVFVLIGSEVSVSGVESLIKAGEQSAAEPASESKSGK